ncbi:MAG: hypothetical protein WCT36_05110 [Candidatus Gracilibacteria bacterium]
MKLNETKIVVVDDKKEDVENLLKLLDKKGIPYNYYFQDANSVNLPDDPLKNIRLLFLDFVLGTDGQPEKTKISTLLTVLKKILHADNGPYIILVWTLHNNGNGNGDLVTPFKLELYKNQDIPKPVAIVDLDKINVMRDFNLIEKKLKKTFDGGNIFEILLDWESNGKVALADVIKTINDISLQGIVGTPVSLDKFSSSLRKSTERNMYQFAASVSGEKNLNSDNGILVDAQLPLGGIFQDHLETYIRNLTPELKRLSRKIYTSRTMSKYSVAERAQMNTFFLLSKNPEACLKPGNIYKTNTILKKIHRSGKVVFRKKDFYNEEKVNSDKTKCAGDATKLKTLTQKMKDFNKRIIPILIEVTPECDYVQKNWKGAKFIFGVLWPEKFLDNTDTEKYLKHAEGRFFHKLPVKYNDRVYFFVLHSDYHCILPLSPIQSTKPMLRAKKELLADIQHWSSAHASRPGKTEF